MNTKAQFLVDRIAAVFENTGLSPVSCRIIACLLICDPAEQSSNQLSDLIHASKGAISSQTRLLIHAGIVEKVRFGGDRKTYYRMKNNDLWSTLLEAELMRTTALYSLAKEALEYKNEEGLEDNGRLKGILDFTEFFAERLPALLAEWRNRGEETSHVS